MHFKLTTSRLFYVFIPLFLASCGGGEETSSEEKTIKEMYTEFKNSDDYGKCVSFDKKLSGMVDPVLKTAALSANPNGLSNVNLDFESNTMAGVYLSPFFRGEHVSLNLADQDNYTLFIKALNEGVEHYKIKGVTNLESSWSYTSERMVNFVKNSEYYVALIVKSFVMPDALDDRNYNSGSFSGRVVVIDTKTEKAIGSFDVLAENSESLMFPEGGIVKAIREDLFKNINENLMQGLKQHCGNVSYGTGNRVPKLEIIQK